MAAHLTYTPGHSSIASHDRDPDQEGAGDRRADQSPAINSPVESGGIR